MIVEMVSPRTRDNDVVTKFREYHQLEIPIFLIFDRLHEDDDWSLLGYQWTPRKYLKINPDERGRLWIDFLDLWLGVDGQRIVCYDGKTDAEIGDYTEITNEFMAERARAQAERERADAEQARADAEQARADAEQARADAMAARLMLAETELARLRGQ